MAEMPTIARLLLGTFLSCHMVVNLACVLQALACSYYMRGSKQLVWSCLVFATHILSFFLAVYVIFITVSFIPGM